MSTPLLLSGNTSRTAGFMTVPFNPAVSPSALPNELRRLSRVVGRYIIRTQMAKESSMHRDNPSRSPELSSGDPASALLTRLISGAPIAVVPLSFSGSSVTTLSKRRAFLVWSTPVTDAAPSAEHERTISVPLRALPDPLTLTPSLTSPLSPPEHDDKDSTHDDGRADQTACLGEMVPIRRGRHRGPVHRSLLGHRLTRRGRRRTGMLSSLQRASLRFYRRYIMRRDPRG
jgi:hypothetical protein